jgi:Protein of unknown function (DUF732)
MKIITTACVLLAITLIPACSISARISRDDGFATLLSSQSIPGDRGVEIGVAHQICDATRRMATEEPTFSMEPGSWWSELKAGEDRLTGQGLSPEQVTQFIDDAVNTYCPDVKDALSRANTP